MGFVVWKGPREQWLQILLSLVVSSSREALLSTLGRSLPVAALICGDDGCVCFWMFVRESGASCDLSLVKQARATASDFALSGDGVLQGSTSFHVGAASVPCRIELR